MSPLNAFQKKTAWDIRQHGLPSFSKRGNEVQQLSRNCVASETPRSHKLVRAASENAICLQMMWTGLRGVASVFATLFVPIGAIGLWGVWLALSLLAASMNDGDVVLLFLIVPSLVAMLYGVGAAVVLAIRGYRIDIFGPKEIPLILNRKTRKVYRLVQEVPGFGSYPGLGFLRASFAFARDVFKPWPMVLIEYDWDCLEAEYFERRTVMGNVVKTFHVLQFCVRESPNSENVIGTFTIASPMMVGRDAAMNLWEFIRRYMEEGGPGLPPGDEPSPPHPRTLLQSAQTVAPKWWVLFLAGCLWSTWRYAQPDGLLLLGFEAVVLFFVAFVCDLMMLVIIFNWLAHKFGQRVTLPGEVMADAGSPLVDG
jgi:hypothetical protein